MLDQTLEKSANEAKRLAALADYDILDTAREQDFDEVADLASKICGTPIAVVNFIGEGRQFFKAEVGLGVRETPLETSFCARAILEEDFLIVPDATQDPRFDCNPLVTSDPGLRFYAGALLKTGDGHAIGTVCVLDFVPRQLDDVQQQTLRVLARQVMRQLELRRVLRERDRMEAHRNMLNQELAHRLKNTLAVVQAIASQTLKDVSERSAVEALERRIIALGKAHDVLVQENWTAAPLRKVAELVLQPHDESGRINLKGPDIDLGPRATLSLSLLLNELATNAAKYGALSNDAGRIELSWSFEQDAPKSELVLRWDESGGPPVIEPARKGFGTKLIGLGLTGSGGVEKHYSPTGFRAVIRAPLSEVTISKPSEPDEITQSQIARL